MTAAKKKLKSFKSVAIYTHHKPKKEKQERQFLLELKAFFAAKGIRKVHGDLRTVSLLNDAIPIVQDDQSYDLKIGIGGDGTLLKMVRTLQKKDGLFLGINFGTLGFLSELSPTDAFQGLEAVINGEYRVDERMLIKAFVWRKDENGNSYKVHRGYSLNEVAFGHGGQARLTNYSVKINRRKLSIYRSDGLVFATPTGSTAYSLSAGGPIVAPEMDSIIVTPVAPHRLSHRPIVLQADKVMHIEFDSRMPVISMTIDGQVNFSLRPTDKVSIQKATRKVQFIRLKQAHFLRTLRNKMGWGEK
jgi:NAD+ kinase